MNSRFEVPTLACALLASEIVWSSKPRARPTLHHGLLGYRVPHCDGDRSGEAATIIPMDVDTDQACPALENLCSVASWLDICDRRRWTVLLQ